ncbi:MAG TPA: septal ring lytic transglycosylase RlpA family protein [Acidobacteriaceae bacterium]|nr:septal ring lytic transglycosylase RlpA family protein [Acidobacteriaceae bacterium]
MDRAFDLRRLWLASAMLAMAALAGCHHKQQAVYQPPPPPPSTQTADAGGARPGAGSRSGSNAPVPRPPVTAEQPEGHGRVVSSEVGIASWYGPPYTNRKAADGSIYDQNAMTAAHRTLPMGSVVRVTNLSNGESVMVRITDRGPFIDGRIIDLSLAAAKLLDVYRPGTAKVQVEAFAPPQGSDPAGRWCVQIGAFLDPAEAVQLKADLMRRFTTAKVIEFAGPTGHWVRINPPNGDRATADRIADSIHIPDPNAQPYLVRLN